MFNEFKIRRQSHRQLRFERLDERLVMDAALGSNLHASEFGKSPLFAESRISPTLPIDQIQHWHSHDQISPANTSNGAFIAAVDFVADELGSSITAEFSGFIRISDQPNDSNFAEIANWMSNSANGLQNQFKSEDISQKINGHDIPFGLPEHLSLADGELSLRSLREVLSDKSGKPVEIDLMGQQYYSVTVFVDSQPEGDSGQHAIAIIFIFAAGPEERGELIKKICDALKPDMPNNKMLSLSISKSNQLASSSNRGESLAKPLVVIMHAHDNQDLISLSSDMITSRTALSSGGSHSLTTLLPNASIFSVPHSSLGRRDNNNAAAKEEWTKEINAGIVVGMNQKISQTQTSTYLRKTTFPETQTSRMARENSLPPELQSTRRDIETETDSLVGGKIGKSSTIPSEAFLLTLIANGQVTNSASLKHPLAMRSSSGNPYARLARVPNMFGD